jgi:hypothetical protein
VNLITLTDNASVRRLALHGLPWGSSTHVFSLVPAGQLALVSEGIRRPCFSLRHRIVKYKRPELNNAMTTRTFPIQAHRPVSDSGSAIRSHIPNVIAGLVVFDVTIMQENCRTA